MFVTGPKAAPAADSKDIWDASSVPVRDALEDADDGRERPVCVYSGKYVYIAVMRCRFEIAYKQRVGTEDVYLGMSDSDASSRSCTEIVVKV